MKKCIKLRVILCYITGALSLLMSVGMIITQIFFDCGIIGILPWKVCMWTNGVTIALAVIQVYPLLKLQTNNEIDN